MTNRELSFYLLKVYPVLDTFRYRDLIIGFEATSVSRAMVATARECCERGLSPRMCAVIIWALTMSEQIIPASKLAVKH